MNTRNTLSLPDDDVRREQVEEARRLAAQEKEAMPRRTLSVKPGMERRPTSKPASSGRVEKLSGHEAFLKALETSGATITLEKCDGNKVVGIVKHSDKFTVTIRQTEASHGVSRDRVIFKHDISEFSAITPRPPVPDSKTAEGHAV